MPQFDFTGRTPQAQVQGSGPRDQGTNVRIQSQLQAAQGLQQAVGALDQYGRDRVQEQAKSDMSAFQARRISLEGDYKRDSLKAKNPEELRKLTDKYIKELNNYAEGKREDGTPVFRNGMGKAGYKQFSQGYQAQVKEQAAQQAFEMDRKRDRLNYQISINSGIKNDNPEDINQGYAELVEAGHITPEEAAIEKDKAMTEMSLTYFKEQNAALTLGVEDNLNELNAIMSDPNITQEQKKAQQAQVSSNIKTAFENYRAEVYTDKNLNDQQRKALIDNSKQGLQYLQTANKAQAQAEKDREELFKADITRGYLQDIIKDPGNMVNIGKQYAVQYPNMDKALLTKISNNVLDSHNKFQKSQQDFTAQVFQGYEDKSIQNRIVSMPLNSTEDYFKAIEEVSEVGNPTMKSQLLSWINDNKPGAEKKDPVLYDAVQGLTKSLSGALGLDLTRSQVKKLTKHQRWGIDNIGWDTRPDYIPDEKEGLGIFVGGADAGYRTETKSAIVNEFIRIYNTDGKKAADEFKDSAILEAQTELNKRELGRKYLNPLVRQKAR